MHADNWRRLRIDDAKKPAMVCSAGDLDVWRDFPKGLRVLLLDEDQQSAAETRMKLEEMDYIVFPYDNEKDASEAIRKKAESFHVAIIEVTSRNYDQSLKFLEMAKDLPTVVISNISCLSTVMKCIALGAAEVLEKPLSEDKLRNIWQHVVHKAFNAGGNVLSNSLKPVKETIASMLRLQLETAEHKLKLPSESEQDEKGQENGSGNIISNERFAAPSTPQLIHRVRLLDDGDSKQQRNCSTEKGITENTKESSFEPQNSESKSVDNTCNNSLDVINKLAEYSPCGAEEAANDEEVDSADGSKTKDCSPVKEYSLYSSPLQNANPVGSCGEDPRKENSHISINPHDSFIAQKNSHSYGSKGNKKRMKVDWTPELHRQFVQAVEQLGINQAIPSKILELMKVEGLTRHNVASHLQKFRMHRRHILPKDDGRSWQTRREPVPRDYMQKPVMAFPSFHPNYSFPPRQIYPAWGHPNLFTSGYQMWRYSGFQPWHPPPESWHWQAYTGLNADAWGCPIYPPYSHCSQTNQSSLTTDFFAAEVLKDPYTVNPAEEVINEVVKEAMSKPWLPLPLGLKPPSTDSVLAELHRQGIRTVPPPRTAARRNNSST